MVSTDCNYGISNSNATHRGIFTKCPPNIDPHYVHHASITSTLYKARTPMAMTSAPLTKLPAAAPVVCWGRAEEEAARLALPLAAWVDMVGDPLFMEVMALAAMEVPEAAASADEGRA